MKTTRNSAILLLTLFLTVASANAIAAGPDAPVDSNHKSLPIRVACLGDSITYGVGAGPGWAFPDQLDRMLGPEWDVRNFGHSGASVAKGDKHSIWGTRQYKDALAFHPDVVVIMLGTNDTKPENWADKKDFPKLYKELVLSFQRLSSRPRVFCCTPPYVAKKGNFGINEAGVLEQIPMIEAVAKEQSAVMVDVHTVLDKKDELFKDNVHPSVQGATLIAKAVYSALARKAFEGDVPGPGEVKKDKPLVRVIENPGELSYREAYGLIVTSGIPGDKLAPVKDKFDATAADVEAKIADFENQITENDSQRMKFKHVDPQKAGEYKAKVSELKKDLTKYKRDRLEELVALVPADYKAAFGAAWVEKYVTDRMAPISSTVTSDQRKTIHELCVKEGPTYGIINNTPERSIEDVATYQAVYDQVLNDEQKKRADPK